ncbi:MAG: heavy-metal-associated domain-containing protein [Bacteriovoracaceae bacterium]|nr:heavy-metal-associated domain-containing protein [Bacteriovoracaceae bacterium]
MSKVFVFLMTCMLSVSVWAAKVEVAIEGMTCGMCEGKVTEMLNKTGKCQNVKVSVESKKASFETVKGKGITDSEIKKAVQDAGYDAKKITRS